MGDYNLPVHRLIDSVVTPTNYIPEVDDGTPYVTHSGILKIEDMEFKVYVLNTGERIIDSEDLRKFFGDDFIPAVPM